MSLLGFDVLPENPSALMFAGGLLAVGVWAVKALPIAVKYFGSGIGIFCMLTGFYGITGVNKFIYSIIDSESMLISGFYSAGPVKSEFRMRPGERHEFFRNIPSGYSDPDVAACKLTDDNNLIAENYDRLLRVNRKNPVFSPPVSKGCTAPAWFGNEGQEGYSVICCFL